MKPAKRSAEKTEPKERAKAASTPQAVRGRPFAKGRSGNPSGRPVGALNRSSRVAAALFEGEADAIGRKAIELAKAGDVQAIRLILERLVPPARERALRFDLPAVKAGSDLPVALAAVVAAVASGELLPGEAEKICGLLTAWGSAFEVAALEDRIAALERAKAGES